MMEAMNNKTKLLKTYLYIFGFLNTFIISTVPVVFGDIFLWQPRNLPTEIMMATLYFSMGIVMVVAARNPEKHKSFVDFLVLGNTLHALVMLVAAQAFLQIVLDVLPIGLMGILPLFFYPWGIRNFLIR